MVRRGDDIVMEGGHWVVSRLGLLLLLLAPVIHLLRGSGANQPICRVDLKSNHGQITRVIEKTEKENHKKENGKEKTDLKSNHQQVMHVIEKTEGKKKREKGKQI